MTRSTLYLRAFIHYLIKLWIPINYRWQMIKYAIRHRTLWLTKEQRKAFVLEDLKNMHFESMVKQIAAQTIARELLGDPAHPYIMEWLGPLVRGTLDEYTPKRLHHVDLLLASNTPDCVFFTRLYVEEIIPLHKRLYLKNIGKWDEVVQKLVKSKHSHMEM